MPIVNREKERAIVEAGRAQGKSDEFIKQAIIRFRQSATPAETVKQPLKSTLGAALSGIWKQTKETGVGAAKVAVELPNLFTKYAGTPFIAAGKLPFKPREALNESADWMKSLAAPIRYAGVDLPKSIGTGLGKLTGGTVKSTIGLAEGLGQEMATGQGDYSRFQEGVKTQKEGMTEIGGLVSEGLAFVPTPQTQFASGFLRNIADAVDSGRDPREILAEAATAGTFQAGALKMLEKMITPKAPVKEKVIDKKIDTELKKAIGTTVRGKKGFTDIEKYNVRAREAIKTITENKNAIEFVDDVGTSIKGKLPESLLEASDALNQTKKIIYNKYHAQSVGAGEKGIILSIDEAIGKLDEIIAGKTTRPEIKSYAAQRRAWLDEIGELAPAEMEMLIKELNQSSQPFFTSGTEKIKAMVDVSIANQLREKLDDAIVKAMGTNYQGLKNQYASLKTIEKDLLNKAIVNARKGNKGFFDLADIFTGGDLAHAAVSMDPAFLAKAAVQKGTLEWFKFLNNPNRIIKNLFKDVYKHLEKSPRVPAMTTPTLKQLPTGEEGLPKGKGRPGSKLIEGELKTNTTMYEPEAKAVGTTKKAGRLPDIQGGGLRKNIKRPPLPKDVIPKATTATEFENAVNNFKKKRSEYEPQLTPNKLKDYKNMKTYLSPDKSSGYAIQKDGTLSNLFSIEKGRGHQLVEDAIKNGATKLDAYDGYLTKFYGEHGFKEVSRMKWDDKYAPANWEYDKFGKPDVVEMSLKKAPKKINLK